jgi:hypothetical protein
VAWRESLITPAEHFDARRLAFSLIVTGSENQKAYDLLRWNNVQIPSQYAMNLALAEISRKIIKMADQSCEDATDHMKPGATISIDGSWEHRRNSNRCITCVFSQNQGERRKKIIAYDIETTKGGSPIDFGYVRCPQNLEVIGLIHMLPELMENPNIVRYVHDNDGKTRKVIRDMGWDVIEQVDFGHASKSLEKTIIAAKLTSSKKRNKDIKDSLMRWMKCLLHNKGMSEEDKVQAWKNSLLHLEGHHETCLVHHLRPPPVLVDENDTALVEKIIKLLNSTDWILRKCDLDFSTQANESFNRGKLKYATKDIKWQISWPARMACAVLDRNFPHWKMHLYKALGLPPLNPKIEKVLNTGEDRRLAAMEFYRSKEYIDYKRAYRRKTIDARKAAASVTKVGYKMKDRESSAPKIRAKRRPKT